MSITKELRRFVDEHQTQPPYGLYPSSGTIAAKLFDIADRIDERIEREYIEAPVDADGVPWHRGDKVDGMVGEITYLSLGCIGWQFRLGDAYTFECEKYHHAKPDSWERIIADATDAAWLCGDALDEGDFELRCAELVERCKRLAGE